MYSCALASIYVQIYECVLWSTIRVHTHVRTQRECVLHLDAHANAHLLTPLEDVRHVTCCRFHQQKCLNKCKHLCACVCVCVCRVQLESFFFFQGQRGMRMKRANSTRFSQHSMLPGGILKLFIRFTRSRSRKHGPEYRMACNHDFEHKTFVHASEVLFVGST